MLFIYVFLQVLADAHTILAVIQVVEEQRVKGNMFTHNLFITIQRYAQFEKRLENLQKYIGHFEAR